MVFVFSACHNNHRLLVGGYNKPGENGFSVYDFDDVNGELTLVSMHDVGENPSFFCYSPAKKIIYVLNEVMEYKGENGGGVAAYAYSHEGGKLEKLCELRIPYGGPCNIAMSPDSAYLFIASYPNGSVAVVKLDEKGIPLTLTDTILFDREEPGRSHGHMITAGPSGGKIYVSDLGLDRIMIYDFNKADGKLEAGGNDTIRLPKGSGPRHFTFNASGSFMYLINELGSTIMVFRVGDNGSLTLMQTLPTVREGFNSVNYCADIHFDSQGRYLYGSNRGENTIVTFRVLSDGTLELAGHVACGGNWPRNFTIDPSGKYLLVGNQKSDTISVLKIDGTTGLPSGKPKYFKSKAPSCLRFI